MSLSISEMALMSRLLDEALPLDTEGRRRWLEALSPEHRSLGDALRQALFPPDEKSDPAEWLEAGQHSPFERIGYGPQSGDPVGPYRLVRLLGEGGMAQVWLAQRADGAFKREVALKLPMLVHVRKDLASRFARERDILAGLEHPHIARLYDAGVSSEGVPYIAMEYVDGEPLTSWCDSHRLEARQRLKLYLQVLDAVQYAHSQRVIHRDIKPSNILVTASGQVRLLDFGIAKLLVEEDSQAELTRHYGGALTPDYASPELIRGINIGAASDVYSLGVVLYELLTGNRPYRLAAGGSMLQIELALSSIEPQRPSSRVAPGAGAVRGTSERKLARRLTGDLDAIVLKTLAKSPSSRYGSATALADDLQRHLAGEPVEARPNRLSYRCGKLILRHPRELAACAVAILGVAGALAYILERSPGPRALSATLPPADMGPVPAPQKESIAVLPFTDMSETHDQQYFSDGLSEELIDHLVHSADLKVIARTSSFQFRDKDEDIRSIARQLGVTNVLEGSVRKDGQQLRITAHLIRATDGVDLWSQTYARNVLDIFKMQDEIAAEVAQALHANFADALPTAGRQPDLAAYDLVLEGRYFESRKTPDNVAKAIELYRHAIDLDQGYALAWARLAHAYLAAEAASGPPTPEQNRRILDALNHAIHLDRNLIEAYYTRAAFELNITWDWAAAHADDERMRAIDPRSNLLPRAFAGEAFVFGQLDRAIGFYQQALARDPLDSNMLDDLGRALCAARRFEACLQSRLRLIQLHPEFDGVDSSLGMARLYLGQLPAALPAMQRESNANYRLRGVAVIQWTLGRRAQSDASLRALTAQFASKSPYGIAAVHAWRGEIDEAFGWLRRAYRLHDPEMNGFKTDPELANLRADARFPALLSQMRLADP